MSQHDENYQDGPFVFECQHAGTEGACPHTVAKDATVIRELRGWLDEAEREGREACCKYGTSQAEAFKETREKLDTLLAQRGETP